jgi:hypothetical protein
MATVMNMSGYEIERAEGYDDEVMLAGWNPQLTLASICSSDPVIKTGMMPHSLVDVDVDAFLNMMHVCRR